MALPAPTKVSLSGRESSARTSAFLSTASTSPIRVFTDGSFSSSTPDVGGFGVHFPDGQFADISQAFTEGPTNQRAELFAVLCAINTVRNEHKCDAPIHIYSDSRYVIDACTAWWGIPRWKHNGWKTTKKEDVSNQDILRPLSTKLSGVSFHHVRAHTDGKDDASMCNAVVDKLAKQAIKNYTSSKK